MEQIICSKKYLWNWTFLQERLKNIRETKFIYNPVQDEANLMLKKYSLNWNLFSKTGRKTLENQNVLIIPFKMKQMQSSKEYFAIYVIAFVPIIHLNPLLS